MKRKLLRITSVVLLLNILTSTLAPSISYALTAGPTAPEYTSFEPIDATDMVNLATGDFTYSIPLFEVPGPEGGYPLSMSYHAGISPEEEGSWVGLGWGLNVGAINRIVNIHPDDMNNESVTIHDTWSGGETETYSIGIGVGINDAVSVGVGVDFANDTYKGSGTGVNINAGIGGGDKDSQVGVGISAGLGPYGGGYVGVNLTAGTAGQGVGLSGNIGLTASFGDGSTHLSGTAGASVTYNGKGKKRYNNMSLIGAEISTDGGRVSTSVAGISVTAISDNSNNIISKTSGFSASIPIFETPLYINLGHQKTRYYTDSYDLENQLGVLYANAQDGSQKQSFDSYALKSATSANPFFDGEFDMNGGSLPAYDSYNVVAQGLSGSIQPYLFESGTITRKVQWNQVDGSLTYVPANGFVFDNTYKPYSADKKVSFRFMNEFSNSMVLNTDNLLGSSLDNYKVTNSNYAIGKDQKMYNDNTSTDFNSTTGALAGSKHVEWFTNDEITNAFLPGADNSYPNRALAKGFIPNVTDRNTFFSDGIYGVNIPDNIGGFMITNSSGVSYHYAQPVYNFEETQVMYANTANQGNSYRRIDKPVPYAYTWLLTSVTGPDYVDRGIIGQIDEADWGYWVKFEYGKWTDQYIWRTP
ncbi:MAG TPA: hypothetical protein VNW06_06595, partial [Cytophagaceae bacterium]|nr:hypothetical protein [Cytophagaceae bacterium]